MVKTARNLLLLILASASLLLLVSCGKTANETGSATAVQTEVPPEEEQESDALSSIETDYGDLMIPEKYKSEIKADVKTTDDSCTVTLTTDIGDTTYSLFVVNIGKEAGQFAGTITGNDGEQREVYIDVPEVKGIDDLSTEDQDKIYAMQEAINTVVDHMK